MIGKQAFCLFILAMVFLVFGCTAHAPINKSEDFPDPTNHPPAGLMVLDALIVRPVFIGLSTASAAFYIGLSPLLYITGIGEPTARVMVETPWRYTAGRPLGDFTGNQKDGRPIYIHSQW
jgi:hypothetical protein